MNYRRGIRRAVAEADGVVVIAHDVAEQTCGDERLPVDPERTLRRRERHRPPLRRRAGQLPAELQRARAGQPRPFLLVLGTNYGHKNRDLAIQVVRRLRERHPSLELVMAGVAVARGSSRVAEAVELRADDRCRDAART